MSLSEQSVVINLPAHGTVTQSLRKLECLRSPTAKPDRVYQRKLVPCGTDGRLLLSGFQSLMTLTLTLEHTAYRHGSFIDLYLHTKFH